MMARFGFLAVVILALGACSSMPHPEGKPLPGMTFSHLKALGLNVAARDISVQPTDNQARFSQNLDEMTEIYLTQKLHPQGERGKVVAALDESSIVVVEENSPNAAADFFGIGGFDVYKVAVKLRLEHYDDAGNLVYGTVVNAHRGIKISEHASIAEREHTQFEGLEQLFLMLDQRVNKILIQDMEIGVGGIEVF